MVLYEGGTRRFFYPSGREKRAKTGEQTQESVSLIPPNADRFPSRFISGFSARLGRISWEIAITCRPETRIKNASASLQPDQLIFIDGAKNPLALAARTTPPLLPPPLARQLGTGGSGARCNFLLCRFQSSGQIESEIDKKFHTAACNTE